MTFSVKLITYLLFTLFTYLLHLQFSTGFLSFDLSNKVQKVFDFMNHFKSKSIASCRKTKEFTLSWKKIVKLGYKIVDLTKKFSVRVNFCNFHSTQCGNYGNSLSRIFDKYSVKVTVLLNKLQKSWFDEKKNLAREKFSFFHQTAWKLREFSLTHFWQIFRESNGFTE